MPFVTAIRNSLLEHIHGKTSYTMPATLHLALSTTTPAADGTNVTEPSGNGYTRVSVPGSSWGSASAGAITNSSIITFPTASGAGWGTVTHVVAYTASSAGSPLWYASITSQAVASGVTVTIPVGDADSTLS